MSQRCPNCNFHFRVQLLALEVGGLADYPIEAKATYCPKCGFWLVEFEKIQDKIYELIEQAGICLTDEEITNDLDISMDSPLYTNAITALQAKGWIFPAPAPGWGIMKEVTIPMTQTHQGIYVVSLTLQWYCPKCGGQRGEVKKVRSYDGSRHMIVDGWENDCGHVDGYADVRKEAREQLKEKNHDNT